MKILQGYATVFAIVFIIGLMFMFPKFLLGTVAIVIIAFLINEFRRGVLRDER